MGVWVYGCLGVCKVDEPGYGINGFQG